MMNSQIKFTSRQFVTLGIALGLLILGFVSIGNAQTATLNFESKVKGFCDDGETGAEPDNFVLTGIIVVDFGAFPELEVTISGPDIHDIDLSGFAFAKNSKKGVFGVVGSSIQDIVSLNGTYKLDKNGNLKNINGRF